MTTCGITWLEQAARSLFSVRYTCTPATPCRACLVAEVERLNGGVLVLPDIAEADLQEISDHAHAEYMASREEGKSKAVFLFELNNWFRSRLRSAPAGQVLVDARELEALRDLMIEFRRPGRRSIHNWNESMKATCARIDALRSTTGGV